jgi:D-alanyl-D-alanine carboxypeptidase
MRRKFRVSLIIVASCVFAGAGASLNAATEKLAEVRSTQTIQLPLFNSIHVPGNGHVILRPATTQRVRFVKGSLDYTGVTVTDRGLLVIDKCHRKCPPNYQLEIEIGLPGVTKLSVADGGWIRSEGRFSRQQDIAIEVSNGGTIDIRSMPADRVTASIDQGGQIRTVAGISLSATVSHGGVITYWGNARVTRSIDDGGSVERGTAADMTAPPVDDGTTVPDFREFGASNLPERPVAISADSLEVWIDSVRRQHNIPAMGAIVFTADTVLARGVVGMRRSDAAVPVTLSDRFQLGSNTKAITATLLATLVEEGRVKWTTTLPEIFPELRDSMSPEFRSVTVELLLSHHGGISAFDDTDAKDFRSIPRLAGSPTQQRAAFTAWVLRRPPAGPVGRGLYSNGGYTIAGAIAERIAGESWESLVRSHVFKPLALSGTFAWSDSPDVEQPWGHRETRSGTRAIDPRNTDERVPQIIGPAGSVELSLDDYAHFLQMNLRGLEGRDTPLLKAMTVKRIHTSPVTPTDKYGLGWGLQDFDGAPSSVHVGSAGTFYAITIVQPTRNLGVAVFTNAGGKRGASAATDVVKALIRQFAKR